MIDDLDEEFYKRFYDVVMVNKPIKKGDTIVKGLAPQFSMQEDLVFFTSLLSEWYSRGFKGIPSRLKLQKNYEKVCFRLGMGEDKPFLKNEELQKVYDFTGFNLLTTPITKNR